MASKSNDKLSSASTSSSSTSTSSSIIESSISSSSLFSFAWTKYSMLYFNIALYSACYQMQAPVQPYMLQQLSDDAVQAYGRSKSLFNFVQLIGSLICGPLSDLVGAKKLLLISFLASILSYSIIANATSLELFYLAQLPTIFQHAVLAGRTYITMVTPDEGTSRSTFLGYVSVAYGIGMVIGPTIGAYLSGYSLYLSSQVATLGSGISFLLILWFLEDIRSTTTNTNTSSTSNSRSDFTPSPSPEATPMVSPKVTKDTSESTNVYKALFFNRQLLGLLIIKIFFSFAFSIFHGIFAIVGTSHFKLDIHSTGYLLSYVGALGMIANAFLVSIMVNKFGEKRSLVFVSILLMLSLILFSYSTVIIELYILCIPLVLGMSTFATVSGSQLTRLVPLTLKGTVNALDMGVGSAVRMIAPTFATTLYQTYGFSSIGITSSFIMLTIIILLSFISFPNHQHTNPSNSLHRNEENTEAKKTK